MHVMYVIARCRSMRDSPATCTAITVCQLSVDCCRLTADAWLVGCGQERIPRAEMEVLKRTVEAAATALDPDLVVRRHTQP